MGYDITESIPLINNEMANAQMRYYKSTCKQKWFSLRICGNKLSKSALDKFRPNSIGTRGRFSSG